jgi:hypothetical protein
MLNQCRNSSYRSSSYGDLLKKRKEDIMGVGDIDCYTLFKKGV